MRKKNGVLIKISNKNIIDGQFKFPKGVETIGNFACSGRTTLTQLTIPKGIIRVSKFAFSDCTGLTQLTISEGVRIERAAFSRCTGLTQLTIPEGVTIEEGAFSRCTGLTQLTISKKVTIGLAAFVGCTGLTQLTIAEGVTIGHIAFAGCTGLKEITLNKGIISIKYNAFGAYSTLDKIYVYSNDAIEVGHIKALLLTELEDKCVAHPLYEHIEGLRKNTLDKLCSEPKISNRFSYHSQGIFSKLPEEMLGEISKFSGRDNRYYEKAENEMLSLGIPCGEGDLASYASDLDAIANKFIKMSQEHKKYRHEHEQDIGPKGGCCNIS
ncbi:MAG: leucine-rich repeat domain-containing protein [Legionellaceae bacterium]|nr:leucine-rich repeat domain-containing protein [Legionellaceae bacterium]